jgi:hypothetical protein
MGTKKKSAKGKSKKAKAEKPEGGTEAAPEQKADGKMSGLDAAAKVLGEAGEPLGTRDIVERMLAKGLWQTKGKTPAATVYSAIFREIKTKGDASRFAVATKGRFTTDK